MVLRHQMKVLQRQVTRPTPPPRPTPIGGCEQGDAQRPVAVFLGEAGDPAPLTAGTRQE